MATNWLVQIPSGKFMAGIHRYKTKKAAQDFSNHWALANHTDRPIVMKEINVTPQPALQPVIHAPQSICLCGHTGDGESSEHAGLIGHGCCLVTGCKCAKFTWASYLQKGN